MADAEKEQSVMDYMAGIGERAKNASREMAFATTDKKNDALKKTAKNIRLQREKLLSINAEELDSARTRAVAESFIDRMALDDDRTEAIARALEDIAALPDPVGASISKWSRPNGLEIERVRTPIGVIAVIYESRPNVTVDAAAIAIKAGNTVILRGGSECIKTSKALYDCFAEALADVGLPKGAVQFVETTDRAAVGALLAGLNGAIDLVIPRGGKSLVARVQSDARVSVLSHLDGVCHVYIDAEADTQKAIEITINAKMRRTGICGAAETLLIDRGIVEKIWPRLSSELQEKGCEIRGDAFLSTLDASVTLADEKDWYKEYLAPILSVAVVDGVNGAIEHIAKYSSGHTEAIVTECKETAEFFIARVDSAIVMHNASTQFADGGEFGLGAEIGIATGRLHARGPVGVEELMTYKNIVRGKGQVRGGNAARKS